jgi:DNA polymerase-3 subunit gamma/tau
LFEDLPVGPADADAASAPARAEPHRALYLRWRPRRFEDVVGQDHVTRTLRNAVKLGRPAHAYLFTGPRGTGKTTAARILYRAVNCEHAEDGDPCNACALCRAALDGRALDIIEIDAASTGGIADIRDLREKVGYRPNEGRYRVYIIDEAHEMSTAAWDALLKTLEEPPPHALFVMATTEAHKVPATIISRCQRFDFRRIPFEAIKSHLARVADAEGMRVDGGVLERLALVARGGLRDALSLLDQLSAFAIGDIDMSVARAALSLPSIEAVRGAIDGMTRRDPAALMAVIADAAEGGADLRLFAEELVVDLRALLLLRAGADARLTDELPPAEVAWLRERAPAWSIGALMQLIQTLSDALARTRDAAQFQVQTEVALLTACDIEAHAPPPATVALPVAPLESAHQAPVPATAPAPAQVVRVPPPAPAPPEPAEVAIIETVVEAVEVVIAEATPAPEPAPPAASGDAPLKLRWADVVDHVKSRNPLFGSMLQSAEPIALEDSVLVVAFSTEYNRKSAEKTANRQLIETAFERVYGSAYRLRGTVAAGLLDDPVINFAQRTFGGEPKRVPGD